MGSYIEKEVMGPIMAKQKAGMMKMKKMQIKNMLSQKIAMTREIVKWYGGFYTVMCFGVMMQTMKTKKFPTPMLFPIGAMGTILAYQVDMAYGGKINRIKKMKDQVMENKKYWFNSDGDI